VIVEIYRPRLESDNTIYYEFNEIYDIIDPHTVNRRHSGPLDAGNNTPPGAYVVGWARDQASGLSARGIFYCGDCYIMPRYMINVNFGTVFPVENMSYSDFYNSMANNCGRPHAVNYDAKRQRFFSKLIYSGKYIQNTRINDLSKVNSSDSFDLAEKYGPIYKLEEVGDTLRILQRSKPSTLLIGRAGVTQAGEEGMQIISSTKDVLGTLYVQKSDFGTVHPSSYVKKETRGFFFDFYAQAICRDAGNGIQNISEAYGLNDFIREKCLEFEAPENVDVISAYDQQNELVWFTFINKRTEINRLIGGSSFTVAFRDTLGQKDDGFVLFSHSIPDYYGTAKRTLTSFKDGVLWYHNSETAARCNFYGTQYKYWASLVFNKLPLTIKRWLSIFVGSDKVMAAPDAGDISIPATGNNPSGIVSLLKAGAFETVQGKWVAEFGKNMTTNQAAASIEDLVNGDDLEGQTIGVTLEGDETEEHKLLSVEVQGVTSKI